MKILDPSNMSPEARACFREEIAESRSRQGGIIRPGILAAISALIGLVVLIAIARP